MDTHERIVQIIRDHELAEYSWGVDGCRCGDDETERHPEHVASVLMSELGLALESEPK